MTLPPVFEQRMTRLLGARTAAFREWVSTPLTTRGVRANTLKCTPARLAELLELSLAPTPFSAAGFVTAAAFRAGSDPLHHAGAYYMQEPSAMSAVTLLRPQPGERVLDLCAAPGGKTTQIAAALQGEGLLWANEYVPARARVLAGNVERCGVRNAVVSCGDTARIAAALPAWFHAVLADVPCSGEGMFPKAPGAAAQWSEDTVRLCAARSAEILHNAAQCVCPGGRLVLSTCTFAPEENEWAVVRFLHTHPDFTLEPATVPFGEPALEADAIAPFGEADLLPFARTVPLHHARRVWPWNGGEGHFLALFRRAGEAPALNQMPTPPTTEAPPVRAVLEDCFVTPLVGTLTVVGDTARLLPPEYPVTTGVHILAAGVAAAQRVSGRTERWEPAHALFQSAHPQDCRRLLDWQNQEVGS